jgi:ADP-heptose:LPS heptosyltransferase
MAASDPERILVIKLSALGDFVLALAAMKKIREAHPQAHITLLTTPPFEGLAKQSPYFNAVETDGRTVGFGNWLEMIARLRKSRYQRVYDLQTSSRSNLIYFGLWPFPPAWSGIAWGCSLPHRNPKRSQMHTLERHAEQLKDAGIWPDPPTAPGSAPPPDLTWILDKAPVERPVDRGVQRRPYVLFVPGGSAHRPEKRWPAELYGELGNLLHDRGYDVVIIGGPQESEIARAIQRKVRTARDLTGNTDFARIALLGARAAVAVGNDTGPLHLIAAAGAPTIVLFSKASDPARSAPRGHVTVLHADNLTDLPAATVAQAAESLRPSPVRSA